MKNIMGKVNINNWGLPILFLMIPFVVLTGGLVWQSQQLFLLIATTIIVAFSLKNIWVKLFMLYASCWSIYLFIYTLLGNVSIVNPRTGLAVLLFFLSGGLLFKFVSESKLPDEGFYKVIRIAVIIQVAIIISQFFGFSPYDWVLSNFVKVKVSTQDIGPFMGTLGNRDLLACFLAVSFPMFLCWKQEKISTDILVKLLIGLVSVIVFFSPSPGAIAFAGCVAIYLNKGWKTYLLTLLIIIIYFLLFILPTYTKDIMAAPQQAKDFILNGAIAATNQSEGRIWKWFTALGLIFKSPWTMIFGSGPGAFWGKTYPLHNEYIQCWFEFGLIGLFLMLGYVVSTFRYLFKFRNKILLASFGAICIDMGANYSLHIATTAFLIIIVSGLIERKRLEEISWGWFTDKPKRPLFK